jgi:predicted GIY-YIG superfamily endonuclease
MKLYMAWSVYFLQQLGGSKTYIGATLDIDRRLKQHNGQLKGGARATAGLSWKRVCHVAGFPNERAALQFEWAWKHFSKKMTGNAIQRRIQALLYLLGCDKPTSKADDFQEYAGNLQVVWEDESINPANYL